MKKKRLKKRSAKKSFLSSYKFIVVGCTITALFLIFIGIRGQSNQSFCANSISCINDLSGTYKNTDLQAEFLGRILNVPRELAQNTQETQVLGNTTGEKRIEVNLSNQHLYAYEGNNLVYDFPVSTGKWGKTPTGSFHIWVKLRYTRMVGGNQALGTYYNLPNVPYTMFFSNDSVPKTQGFALHGAYWHNNFGHPMSHGCVNIKTENVEKLFYWADPPDKGNTTYSDKDNPGTLVVIYGEAPNE